ncbi:MAG TPA: fibronectin type III domain-containing protein [Pyrinomonadaceae bacterium]|nr:fibronectin type III domain-containing protein [Pyrinomonadaceae bacterium]
MSKNKTVRSKRRWRATRERGRKYVTISTICGIVLVVFVTLAGPFGPSLGFRKISFSPASPSTSPTPGIPSKEYIYAGGRLIATEEPSALAAPANLVASAVSNIQINVSWSATQNAHHYQVERANNFGGTFTVLNSNVSGTTFTDNSVSSVNSYLYRVRSADAVGNLSTPSNLDLATAIVFEDDPFPAAPALTTVKAQHLLQLRQAVNAVRSVANLSAATWSQNPLQQNVTPIMANDIGELRTALDQALGVLGLPAGGYTNSSLAGQLIQKIHIKELRDRVK